MMFSSPRRQYKEHEQIHARTHAYKGKDYTQLTETLTTRWNVGWLTTWGDCQPQTISLRLEHQSDYAWTYTPRLQKRSVLESLNGAYAKTTRYEVHTEGSTRLRSAHCILNQCGHAFVTVHNCAHRYIIEWYYYYCFFPMALQPNAGHSLLILEVSRSNTTHHSQ